MYTLATFTAVFQSADDDGFSVRQIVSTLPTDPASVFVIVLLVVALAAVIWSGRGRKGKGGESP
jgi:hypothetical protein